ncbi:hypothetical protein HMPREF1983_00175, partial [Gemella bergeri ATCC 700627]
PTNNPTPKKPVKDVVNESGTTINGKVVKPGETLTYTVEYKNTTDKDRDVTIKDKIPAYTTYVQNSADNNGKFADGQVTWSKKVAKGDTWKVTFKVKVNDDANGVNVIKAYKKTKESKEKPIFPVIFVGMMSSGKSTLINALLEKEVLDSSNEACTSKVYSILDTDNDGQLDITAIYNDGKIKEVINDKEQRLLEFNKNDDIKEVIISTQIKGVLNTNKKLLLIDTPGVNNSEDETHAEITRGIVDSTEGGLIVYVVNISNAWTDDEKKLLTEIKTISKEKNIPVLFLINKIDTLDLEKESIGNAILTAQEYLRELKFEDFDIFPISGGAANLIKKVLNNGKNLTKKERIDFINSYNLYAPQEFELSLYAITKDYPMQYKEIDINGEKYQYSKLKKAFENTGLHYLELYLQREQIRSEKILNANKNTDK